MIRDLLFKKLRELVLDRMRKLEDLPDFELGRMTRKYFGNMNDRTRLFRKTLVGLPAILFLTASLCSLFHDLATASLFSYLFKFLFTAAMMTALVFYWGFENWGLLVSGVGPIGMVMRFYNRWLSAEHMVERGNFQYYPYDLKMLSKTFFVDDDDKEKFDDIGDWSNEDLGQFMKLLIGCVSIYVHDDGQPNREALDRFLKGVDSEKTMSEIMNHIEENRRFNEKARKEYDGRLRDDSIAFADEMRNKVAYDKPDPNDPDVLRMERINEIIRTKTDELHHAASQHA